MGVGMKPLSERDENTETREPVAGIIWIE